MKAYTDIEQSRKLAEILSLESADQTWARIVFAGASFDIPEEMQYKHRDIPFQDYNGIGTPCWSLAALLSVFSVTLECTKGLYHCISSDGKDFIFSKVTDNPVDACVELIIILHEQNIL